MKNKKNKPGVIIIEGHVQGLANTRALGRSGTPVYVIDTGNCVAKYSKYCKNFFKCPDYHSDELAKFLINLARTENIQDWILLPSNDHAVYTISKNKKELQKYYKIMTEDFDIVKKIYDKSKLIQLAESIDIPVPQTITFDEVNPENIDLQFPILTRGKEGKTFYHATGKKAFKSTNLLELNEHLKFVEKKVGLGKSISQELIPYDGTNKTISFTAFCDKGEIQTYWMGAKLREHPIDFGTATLTVSVFIKDCLIHSEELLKELNYTGVCEVEFLRDPRDNKYKLIEINPRTWLWVGQAIASGINYPLLAYNYLNRIKNSYPLSYPENIKWYNPYTDIFFGIKAIFSGKLSIKEFFEQKKGKTVNALWDKLDPMPFFRYGILMFNMLRNR